MKPPYRGEYSLPGGKLEPGEALYEALKREFYEETGLTVHSAYLYDRAIVQRRFLLNCYRIERYSGAPKAADDAKCLTWIPRTALSRHLRRATLITIQKGLRHRIRHCNARVHR